MDQEDFLFLSFILIKAYVFDKPDNYAYIIKLVTVVDGCMFIIQSLIPLLLNFVWSELTLKEPITTAADDKFCDIFSNFRKK